MNGDYSLCWESDDSFKVVCEGCTNPAVFTLTDDPANPAAGIFSGTLPEGTSENYYAVVNHPDDGVSVNGSNLELEIKNLKSGLAGGIPVVAKVASGGAEFKHIFGLFKITLSASEPFLLKRIALHDLAGNMLWGTCSVPIKDDGSLDYENVTMTGGDNTITMTLTSGKEISTETSYYLPVPKGALDGGFSIVLYEADDTKTDGVGRAYTFMQKITGTMAMPRAGILAVNAPVTAKPEALDVKGRGYYKSLFVNAGYGLDSFSGMEDIPAIEYMELDKDCEYYSCNKTDFGKSTQTSVIVGNDIDANGVLLYPDGSPRFRMVFNSGGSSVTHGQSLDEVGRRRFYDFFNNGGSYASVCAGSFLAAATVSTATATDFTYGFIPIDLKHTSLPQPMSDFRAIYTNMEILDYASTIIDNLNGDNQLAILLNKEGENMMSYSSHVGIKDVMHHGGGYLPADQASTDGIKVLMKYRYSTTEGSSEVIDDPNHPLDIYSVDMHYYRFGNITDDNLYKGHYRDGEYSTWTYKSPEGNTGRAVCTGSHPEGTERACDKAFTGFMFRYAMDGNGDARVKDGNLILGQTRYMNASTSTFNDPATKNVGIGDRQYHHFKFTVPDGGYDNFVLRLDSACDKDSGIDLYLGLRHQVSTDGTKDLAWLSDADYTLCNKGGQKEIRIKSLPAGTWYVSVFCATTVGASERTTIPKYFEYSGKTQVLNGVPYSISIAQDGSLKDYYPVPFGTDGDDFSNTMDD